ncbi:ABC transporter substrate-binding protein [Streptomyces sp. NPDC126503]|uniref:MlaC/ttg2D family ABC transporter substrate-binding protein n=1 Tax=Streptomyces sp. NPDC126503 TaxID=3155315 RepID=UPI00331684D8
MNAQELIKSVTQQVLDEARQSVPGGDSWNGTFAAVNKYFVPHCDFRRTTKLAVGRSWRTATSAQQEQVFEQFEPLLVRTVTNAFEQAVLSGGDVEFPPFREGGRDTVVCTVLPGNDGQPISICYRLNQSSTDGWRIYDMSMSGVWTIQMYRQQFAETLPNSGFDALIQSLTQENQRLALTHAQRSAP